MIKKGLFKAVKMFAVAAVMALGIMVEAGMSGNGNAVVTTYAQEYYDSTDYHLNLDDDGVWRCYNSGGQLDTEYDGIVENEYGWWKVSEGQIDFSYTGMILNQYGWWYVDNGMVDFNADCMALNQYGWWKITDGTVDFTFNGLAENEYGWWKMKDGTVDFSYNGIAQNQYGWWKVDKGAVNLNANGLIYDEGTDTWWYFKDGYIDFSYTELASNDYGEWKICNGSVDFGFKGIAKDDEGSWYVHEGKVDKTYTGTFEYDGYTYDVVRGRATRRKITATRNVLWYDLDGTFIDKDTVIVEVDNKGQMTDDYYYNGYIASRQYNLHGGYFTKICIGSSEGTEYNPGTLLVKKSNLNLRDYDGDISLYYVKVNKL